MHDMEDGRWQVHLATYKAKPTKRNPIVSPMKLKSCPSKVKEVQAGSPQE